MRPVPRQRPAFRRHRAADPCKNPPGDDNNDGSVIGDGPIVNGAMTPHHLAMLRYDGSHFAPI
jgi:hypothetical protein